MSQLPLKVGDEVVHQSHPGRFTITAIEDRPSMNVYSRILTIRSLAGLQMRVLDTTVRRLAAADRGPEAAEGMEGSPQG